MLYNGQEVTKPHGILYLVATPIGNLEDITIRGLNILKKVDLIAAEDTRQTQKLLQRYQISTPMTSYHSHNMLSKTRSILQKLKSACNIALVSDAGTPGISDPGYYLVKSVIDEGIQVVPIPGASASICALTVSGLPTDRFGFEGFLPSRAGQRRKRLQELILHSKTLIFYEAPHRLLKTLEDMKLIFGGTHKVCIVRELTKKFEEIKRGSLDMMIDYFKQIKPRGEFVIVLAGATAGKPKVTQRRDTSVVEHVLRLIEEQNITKKEAVKQVAKLKGVDKKELYKQVVRLSSNR